MILILYFEYPFGVVECRTKEW